MDAATIASLATAGGTLVLAIATFGATRSANRAARISEQALQVGLRPVLFNARPQDPSQKVGYGDDHWVLLHDGLAVAQLAENQNIYLAIPLRNVAQGIAVLHGWYLWPRRAGVEDEHPELENFHTQTRDLYVPAGDVNFWQAALRDPHEQLYDQVREAISTGGPLSLDLLYGDHEGGQRTITRFYMIPRHSSAPDDDAEPWLRMCSVSRHWNIDRADPR
ncbi:MAG TPA: hypothetical protein VMB05_16890 [Solirubrobacteraceae bacterium]|nr:hypothetical protein [Solirubrobacteraceae bacterium]